MQDQTPGGIITPQQQGEANSAEVPAPAPPVVAEVAPIPAPQPVQPEIPQPESISQPDLAQNITQNKDASFDTSESQPTSDMLPDMPEPVFWTASEYIAHQKKPGWFIALGAVVAVLVCFVYFVTGGDIFSCVCILVLAILFGLYARRLPKEQSYMLDVDGVHIGSHIYPFDALKTFSVRREGPFSSIMFVPMKRFMPMITVYFDPVDEDRIVEYLSGCLPLDYRGHDPVERLMHKIKF